MNWKEKYGGAALITGASSGIGEALAWQLAEKGMDLVLVARRQERLECLAKKLNKQYKINTTVIPIDLTDFEAPSRIKDELDQKGIEIGMLVNNAGFGTFGEFSELQAEKEIAMVLLNCLAPVALTSLFSPSMKTRGTGAIIFLASISAYQPTPFMATYGATKSFNLLLGEALWGELRGAGIDVIVLSPGLTRTEFQSRAGLEPLPSHLGWAAALDWATADDVVKTCLKKLGKGPSVVHGVTNKLLTFSLRFMPRKFTAWLNWKVMKTFSVSVLPQQELNISTAAVRHDARQRKFHGRRKTEQQRS